MLQLIVVFLFNGFLFSMVIALGGSLFFVNDRVLLHSMTNEIVFVLGYVLEAVLLLLSTLPITVRVYEFSGSRKLTVAEMELVNPSLNEALQLIDTKFSIVPNNLRIRVTNSFGVGVMAIGAKTIILEERLLKSLTGAEIQIGFIIAIQQLINHYGKIRIGLYMGNLGVIVIIGCYKFYHKFVQFLSKAIDYPAIVMIVGILPLLLFLPVVIFYYMWLWLIKPLLQKYDKNSYLKSDQFALTIIDNQKLRTYWQKVL